MSPTRRNAAPASAKLIRHARQKRARRTKADIASIREAIIDIIADDYPMTVRQVFYQLVARGVIDKTEEEYQRTVIRLMTDMRLNGDLPYTWVVDETRRVRVTQTFDSIEAAPEHTAQFYRKSALAQSPDYVEVWCEKDALAGVLWEVTSDYDVPLMVSRGMPSLTFLHASAMAIQEAAAQGKQSYIYQFGDHDPSGVLIPQIPPPVPSSSCMPPTAWGAISSAAILPTTEVRNDSRRPSKMYRQKPKSYYPEVDPRRARGVRFGPLRRQSAPVGLRED